MRTIEFTLSDFSSLQKELIGNFNFTETDYNLFEPKENNKSLFFFRRVFIESGLEVWIFSMKFNENILLKQRKSNNTFCATHFHDFDGTFYSSEVLRQEQDSKGIYITSGEADLSFRVKANEKINFISFVYSKRWLDINLLNTPHYKDLFDENYLLKKYTFHENLKNSVSKLINNAQKGDHSGFILKTNIFNILWSVLEFTKKEIPIDKIKKISINDFTQQVEEMLSTDFETPLSMIYYECEKNGFSKIDFIKYFKEKNNLSLLEYRQIKRIKLTLELLDKGIQINEVSKKAGFKNSTKFMEYFNKERRLQTPMYNSL